MLFFSKYKFEIIVIVLLILFFFITRLQNIMSLPMFTDEAIYVRWAQIAKNDANWRFISLTDGKQPSFIWAEIAAMKLFADPLFAGRIVSVFAGFLTMIGLFFLGREIFRRTWIGILSSTLYVLFPMALVYDRMALYDSLVGTFMIWSLYFTVLLARYLRLDAALLLSMSIGGAVLTKTSGFFSIYLLPLSALLVDFRQYDRRPLLRWLGLIILAAVLGYGYYFVLRLSPFYHIIGEKNAIFVYPFSEWIQHPIQFFWGNLMGVTDWALTYLTLPIALLIAAAFIMDIQKLRDKIAVFLYILIPFIALQIIDTSLDLIYIIPIILYFLPFLYFGMKAAALNSNYFREKILLVLFFFIPFFALALFGKVLYPRFIFFMLLYLLPLASYTLYYVYILLRDRVPYGKFAYALLFLIVISLAVRADERIINKFTYAPIPYSDQEQYINGWPAGGGAEELVAFLDAKSKEGKLYVATEGTFGSLPTYAVEIYLDGNKNIEKRGIWPLPIEFPRDLEERAARMPVYFVLNQTQEPPLGWPLRKIDEYRKGISDYYMTVYEVIPSS